MSKYPELKREDLAPGVSYACAYMRLENGWSLDRAISTPTRVRRTQSERARARKEAREAKLWLNSKARKKIDLAAQRKKRVRHRKYNSAEDTSPPRIQKIRAAFCAEFIKTGAINVKLQTKLMEYAREFRATQGHPDGIPPEHASRRYGQEAARMGDDGGGSSRSTVSSEAARHIADFLRS